MRRARFDGRHYGLELTAAETETGRPYCASVPSELTSDLDSYIQVYRPSLQSIARASDQAAAMYGHLWFGYLSRPMSSGAIRAQIERRTRQAFGKAIWPHVRRELIESGLSDLATTLSDEEIARAIRSMIRPSIASPPWRFDVERAAARAPTRKAGREWQEPEDE